MIGRLKPSKKSDWISMDDTDCNSELEIRRLGLSCSQTNGLCRILDLLSVFEVEDGCGPGRWMTRITGEIDDEDWISIMMVGRGPDVNDDSVRLDFDR